MAKRYRPEDLDAIQQELQGASARATIAVAGSLLEAVLEETLAAHFRPPANKIEEGLMFSDMGLLGSFNEKIWMAYFMKIIGPRTRRDLDLIRNIRNEVAHNMNPVSFDDSRIKSRIIELNFGGESEWDPDKPKDKFLAIVHLIAGALHLVLGIKASDRASARRLKRRSGIRQLLLCLAA